MCSIAMGKRKNRLRWKVDKKINGKKENGKRKIYKIWTRVSLIPITTMTHLCGNRLIIYKCAFDLQSRKCIETCVKCRAKSSSTDTGNPLNGCVKKLNIADITYSLITYYYYHYYYESEPRNNIAAICHNRQWKFLIYV